MAKKGARQLITLACTKCKERNYTTTKNVKNTTDKVELKKFCKRDRAVVAHKETK
ncbi:50S ribosomal protein L33 [bacterium (Candidatus Howlettbacteria) CG_4_10_14_0_8_um_filter_40_9]|nr:MAG: 50S ribosomal protein L33 [bacterium (Candidatus Howlettbacteria) CG_4_10_14_0_8_um_filter_40_9]